MTNSARINTFMMSDAEFVSTFPAEACTEIGADDEMQPGEGGAIAALWVAAALVFGCLGAVHLLARWVL